MAKETFGSTLKKLREAAGFTQGQLAEKVGVTREHIARLESNPDASPTWKTVVAITSALGVSCEVFQDVATPKPRKGKA